MFAPSISPNPRLPLGNASLPSHDPRFAAIFKSYAEDPELRSLRQEADPRLFSEDLWRWALRRESLGDLPGAAQVYAILANAEEPEFASRGRRRLDLLKGEGPWRDRAELYLKSFAREALHPAGILGMSAGSLAFRLTRLATLNRLLPASTAALGGSYLGARFVAALGGFAAEVPAMLFATKGLQTALGENPAWDGASLAKEWLGNALFLSGMKLGGALLLPFQGGANPAAFLGARPFLAHASQVGGAILGKTLELRVLNAPNRGSWFLEGLAAYLQGRAGAGLAQSLLGSLGTQLELGLALRSHQIHLDAGPPPQDSWREVSHLSLALPTSSPTNFPGPAKNFSLMSGLPSDLPLVPRNAELWARYRPRFPPDGLKSYSEEILATALEIPLPREAWRERLLEALAATKGAGTYDQLLIAEGLKKIFSYDGLRSGIGSFDLSLLQFAFEKALQYGNARRRGQSLRMLFYLMTRDLSRPSLGRAFRTMELQTELILEKETLYPRAFLLRLASAVEAHWKDYRSSDIHHLLNFVYTHSNGDAVKAEGMIQILGRGPRRYPQEELRSALDYADASRWGKLILRRFFLILATDDIPAKLRELQADPSSAKTSELTQQFTSWGLSTEEMAQALNGSRHNAYMVDLRLARKIVEVEQAASAAKTTSDALRLQAKLGLQRGIRRALQEREGLQAETLLQLLQWNPDPATQRLIRDYREGRFDLRIVGEAEFQSLFRAWGMARRCDGALFVKAYGDMKRDLILVRELSHPAREGEEPSHAAYEELLLRLEALVHEWEHFRHFNGEILLQGISREARLVSEIMASLEEDRWQSYFSKKESPMRRLAGRLGQNLPLYLRDFHDWIYFSRSNVSRSAGWLRD